jgi:LEA14-like dessication related protein
VVTPLVAWVRHCVANSVRGRPILKPEEVCRRHQRAGTALAAGLLGCAGAAAAALLACCALAQLKAPTITPESVEVTDLQIEEQRFKVRLDVQNPNDRPLPIKSVTCTLAIAGIDVGRGESAQPFSVPANGDTEFDLLVETNLVSSVPDLLRRILAGGEPPKYRFSGWVNPDIALMPPIPFSKSGELELQ